MRFTGPIALVVLLLTGGCVIDPGYGRWPAVEPKPLRGGVAEFTLKSYDGRYLEGRLLIAMMIDPIAIDTRLWDWVSVEFKNLHACGKKEPLKHLEPKGLPRPPWPEEIFTLRERGVWIGRDLVVLLFDEELTQNRPACFEAEIVVRDVNGRIAARLPLHVARTDQPRRPRTGVPHRPSHPPRTLGLLHLSPPRPQTPR